MFAGQTLLITQQGFRLKIGWQMNQEDAPIIMDTMRCKAF